MFAGIWTIYLFNKSLFTLENFFHQVEFIQNFISNNFLLSFVFFIFLYSLLVICNFPVASILSMIGGFLFSTWLGGIGIIIGGSFGSLIIFIISKYFFFDHINKTLMKKYPTIPKYFKKNDLELLLLIRIIPGIPFFVQNLILAGLGPSNIKFFFTTFVGISPWAFIFASFGKGLEEIFIKEIELSIFSFLKLEYVAPLVLFFLLVVFFKIFKKKLNFHD